jgi:hypothetical protein
LEILRRVLLVISSLYVFTMLPSCSAPSSYQVISNTWQKTISYQTAVDITSISFNNATVTNAPKGTPNLLSSPNEKMGGDGEFNLSDNDGSFTLSTPNFGVIEVDIVKSSFYLHFPVALLSSQINSAPWLYIDTEKIASLKTLSFVALSQLFIVLDPSFALDYTRGADSNVIKLGNANVGGTPCTNYRFTVNINKAASNFKAPISTILKQAALVLHSNTQQVTSCIDALGRDRRNFFTVNLNHVAYPVPGLPYLTESLSGSMTIDQTLTSFINKPFNTVAPPANEVVSLKNLIK